MAPPLRPRAANQSSRNRKKTRPPPVARTLRASVRTLRVPSARRLPASPVLHRGSCTARPRLLHALIQATDTLHPLHAAAIPIFFAPQF
jgi:hypothetical protein